MIEILLGNMERIWGYFSISGRQRLSGIWYLAKNICHWVSNLSFWISLPFTWTVKSSSSTSTSTSWSSSSGLEDDLLAVPFLDSQRKSFSLQTRFCENHKTFLKLFLFEFIFMKLTELYTVLTFKQTLYHYVRNL